MRIHSGKGLLAVVLAGLSAAAANAETGVAHNTKVPDFSSNLAGWVATDRDFMPVRGPRRL